MDVMEESAGAFNHHLESGNGSVDGLSRLLYGDSYQKKEGSDENEERGAGPDVAVPPSVPLAQV